MSKYLWPITTMGLVLLMGVALLTAPFGLHFYVSGHHWNHATYWTFWTGVGVVVVAAVGLYGWITGIGEEGRRILPPRAEAEATSQDARADAGGAAAMNGDEALQQLARAVLRDLNQRLGDGGTGAGMGGA